jgi:hypothetical protein
MLQILEEPRNQTQQITWETAHILGLQTITQWGRQGRKVRQKARKDHAALVPWNGQMVRVFSEDQTHGYTPRPETVAFNADADYLFDFVRPRCDPRHWGVKARKQWEDKAWPQPPFPLDDETWRRACRHKEGLAVRPSADAELRWYSFDLDYHDRANPDRFLARIAAVYDLVAEQGDDMFFACRERNVSGLHCYGFGLDGLPLSRIREYADGLKEELIRRHPDLFDSSLEIFPDPSHNFRLPLFPGRCPIIDRPLEGLPAREQLHELVEWLRNPGRPMAKEDLLAWVRERLPVVVVPAGEPARPTPEPELSEEEFWSLLGGRPAKPLHSLDEEFDERHRAEFVGKLAEWEGVRSPSGWDAAKSFLDGVAPPSEEFVAEWRRALDASWRLRKVRKEDPRVFERWQAAYRSSGWEAARAYLDSVAESMATRATEPIVAGKTPVRESLPPAAVVPIQVLQTRSPEGLPVAEPSSRPARTPDEKKASRHGPGRLAAAGPRVTPFQLRGLGGSARGKLSYTGNFFELQDFFWGRKGRPADGTLDSYTGPHMRLALEFGHGVEEIIGFCRRHLLTLPDTSFSRRLSENPEGLLKSYERSLLKMEGTNCYQPDPESSRTILGNIARAMRAQNLDPLDPTSFARYRRGGGPFEVKEYDLAFDDRLKVKAALSWLHPDIAIVYSVARRVIGWAEANPGRQLSGKLVPVLCSGLAVEWFRSSDFRVDGQARRCKLAERVLRSLVEAGLLNRTKEHLWIHPHHPDNKAAEYAPGEALQAEGGNGTGGGEATTIGDTPPAAPSRFAVLVPEVRRLTRLLRRLRGPPRRAA